MSGALKIFSRYIHLRWYSTHFSTISWRSYRFCYIFSAFCLRGLTYLLARILFIEASPSSNSWMSSSTSAKTHNSFDSLYCLRWSSTSSHLFSTKSSYWYRLSSYAARTDMSIISSWYLSTCNSSNFFNVNSESVILNSLFKIDFISLQWSSVRYSLRKAVTTGIVSLYFHTIPYNYSITLFSVKFLRHLLKKIQFSINHKGDNILFFYVKIIEIFLPIHNTNILISLLCNGFGVNGGKG